MTTKWSAPSPVIACSFFVGEVLKTVTFNPKAFPNFTAICPRPKGLGGINFELNTQEGLEGFFFCLGMFQSLTSESNNAKGFSRLVQAKMNHGTEHRDSCAKEWGSSVQRQIIRDL